MRKFTQLNGEKVKVLLEHCLFDKQVFHCDELKTINDDNRIGLILKSQEVFLYKHDVKYAKTYDNLYILSDGRMTITLIVNKL